MPFRHPSKFPWNARKWVRSFLHLDFFPPPFFLFLFIPLPISFVIAIPDTLPSCFLCLFIIRFPPFHPSFSPPTPQPPNLKFLPNPFQFWVLSTSLLPLLEIEMLRRVRPLVDWFRMHSLWEDYDSEGREKWENPTRLLACFPSSRQKLKNKNSHLSRWRDICLSLTAPTL